MNEVISKMTSTFPWLHLLIASEKLRDLGERNSSSEARKIITEILDKAPLGGSNELKEWLENYRELHSGPISAKELIGTQGWENISKAIIRTPSLRTGENWEELINLRKRSEKVNLRKQNLADAWKKLPELKSGADDTLK